ncbi:peroxidase family protein [Metarhizium anisopliae]
MPGQLPPYRPSLFDRVLTKAFGMINKVVPWYKFPAIIGVLNLEAIRTTLRRNNLHDGYPPGHAVVSMAEPEPMDERFLHARNSDGKYNSLTMPRMGCAGMRFGRQFPREYCRKPTEEELWNPNPRVISERFMKRREGGFIPATTLNLLAAAWIQFQTHDWMAHEKAHDSYNIPLPEGDGWPGGRMELLKTQPDEILDASDIETPGYKNVNTAWWDGSQIYGSSEVETERLRTGHEDGKLRQISYDAAGVPLTGFVDNWWFGLHILHSLFVLEHNAICDRLRGAYPDWNGYHQDLRYCPARQLRTHGQDPYGRMDAGGSRPPGSADWHECELVGAAGETLTKLVGRLSKTSEIISGIPGSPTELFGVPYSLTEEFVSVVAFFNSATGAHHSTVPIKDIIFHQAPAPFNTGLDLSDAFYSFGINYAGAITNNNYPDFLRSLHTPDGQVRDLGTVDILRDRERGVPRYNQFRRLLGMSAPETFEQLTGGNNELAQELRDVYGDIELVDTLVGSHSEPLIKGFGFSETAFRVFILMASNRLKSDRFFADSWNAQTYTEEGLHWVQHTTMKDILRRHCPELGPVLDQSENVFAPWAKLPKSKAYGGIETND